MSWGNPLHHSPINHLIALAYTLHTHPEKHQLPKADMNPFGAWYYQTCMRKIVKPQ